MDTPEAKALIETVVTLLLADDQTAIADYLAEAPAEARPYIRTASGMIGGLWSTLAEGTPLSAGELWARSREIVAGLQLEPGDPGFTVRPLAELDADEARKILYGPAGQPIPQVGQYAHSLTRTAETDPLGGIVVAVDEDRAVAAIRCCWGGVFHLRRHELGFDDIDPETSFVDAPGKTCRSIVTALCRTISSLGRNARFTEEHRQMLDDAHSLAGRAS